MCLHTFKHVHFVFFIFYLGIICNDRAFPVFLGKSLCVSNSWSPLQGKDRRTLFNSPNSRKIYSNSCGMGSCVGAHYSFVPSFWHRSHNRAHGPLCSSKSFHFDEKEARRARHRMMVNENIAKKKMARRTMHKIVKAVTKTSSEEHKEMQIQNFLSDVQYSSNRKSLPSPPEIYSPSYDALLYLKGIPFKATQKDVLTWLKDYEVLNVVFIKNENGFFTGDAYVRCKNVQIRDEVAEEMENRTIGGRYIQVFKVSENAYLEYYHSGFRKEPKDRNYIDPSVLVITNNQYNKMLNPKGEDQVEGKGMTGYKSFINNVGSDVDLKDIKTGMRLVGTVKEVYRNGVIVECNLFETNKGVKERVFCILKKNRIAKNVGLKCQHPEMLKTKNLVLYPGIKLNLYVEKIRRTTARDTFDRDMWMEHFEDSLVDTYFGKQTYSEKSDSDSAVKDESKENHGEEGSGRQAREKRALVYLTMDSSVSEDKVLWWEKKILNELLSQYKSRKYEDTITKENINMIAKVEKPFKKHVQVRKVHEGKATVYGNVGNKITFNRPNVVLMDRRAEFKEAVPASVLGDPEVAKNIEKEVYELPEDVPIGTLLDPEYRGDSTEEELKESNVFILDKHQDASKKEDVVEFVDSEYQSLTNKFFKNSVNYGKDIQFHDFEENPEDDLEGDENEEEEWDNIPDVGRLNDFSWTYEKNSRKNLESFPRLTLHDGAIKLPPDGLILRQSEVENLTNEQIKLILELLNKESKEKYEENKETLIEVIKKEGLPNDLLPQTLIQKGLYKVKQSKDYMKNIVRITKDLTGRKFSNEDLDTATSEELEMLVEEALYKFLDWNPPFDLKKQFINNYGHLLEDTMPLPNIQQVVPKPEFLKSPEDKELSEDSKGQEEGSLVDPDDENVARVEKMWNDMKWLIVIFIYGEQSDLKDIVKQLERDKVFKEDPNLKHTPMEMESLLIESK